MSSLQNLYISDSYGGLLHTNSTPVNSTGLVQVYDGFGNPLPLKVSSSTVQLGNIQYPSTVGSNGQVLASNGTNTEFRDIFPIGAVYFTVNDNNPSTFLGGTWVNIAQGRFIVGAGSGVDSNSTSKTFSVGNNDGKYTTTLPSHRHGVGQFTQTYGDDCYFITGDWNDANNYTMRVVYGTGGAITNNTTTGSGTPNGIKTSLPIEVDSTSAQINNVPPGFGMYIWQRTA